MQKKL
jgi:ATP-dependent 26S proteasome regulatory subunit